MTSPAELTADIDAITTLARARLLIDGGVRDGWAGFASAVSMYGSPFEYYSTTEHFARRLMECGVEQWDGYEAATAGLNEYRDYVLFVGADSDALVDDVLVWRKNHAVLLSAQTDAVSWAA